MSDKSGTIAKVITIDSTKLVSMCINNDLEGLKALGISDTNAIVVIDVIKSNFGIKSYHFGYIFAPQYGLEKSLKRFTVQELSIGERVSAVFPLLTINSGHPIILDQPEDDLDHNYIIDNIVGTIRNSKMNQQYIIVTHNPNIPVLGDADQVIKVLRDELNRCCTIEVFGGIDNTLVNEKIAQLEGGIKAIEKRFNRYKG